MKIEVKRALSILLLCLAAAALGGCGQQPRSSPVIATVNGREIRRAEFDDFLKLKMGEFTSPEGAERLRSEMLDEYIYRRVILDEAARAGLGVSEAEIDQAIRENPQMRSSARASDARLQLQADLLIEKYYRQVVLHDVRVSHEEIQNYISENLSRLTDRPGFYVREIRVQSRQEAEKVRREVTESGRDFAAVARVRSEAPNAEQGGLTRYEEGQLPAVLEKPISQLGLGDVSPVIQSSFGFHLFKLEHRFQPVPPEQRRSQLDERRSQLAEELIARKNQQAVEEALSRLTSSAEIRISDQSLGFTYVGRLRHN
jgi:peptidyl-prolyl cis-trans isomerase C